MSKTWTKEADVDPFDQAAVRQCLLDIEAAYNKSKEKLYYKAQSYFHQSIMGDYTTADDLKTMIDACEELKRQYRDFKEFVSGVRGTNHII